MAYRIGLDDGHGKETAGKRTPDGYRENEFNHGTKLFLVDELIRNGFIYTDCSPLRSDNSLQNRCDIANNAKCDLFISIHYNAMSTVWNSNVGGIETYHYPSSTTGKRLASKVQYQLIKGTKMLNRGVKTANFYVLRNTKMTAILVECGFMDNPVEAKLMKSISYRKECASEICRGICAYYGKNYIPESTPKVPYANQPNLKWLYDNGIITGEEYKNSHVFDANSIAIMLQRLYKKLK